VTLISPFPDLVVKIRGLDKASGRGLLTQSSTLTGSGDAVSVGGWPDASNSGYLGSPGALTSISGYTVSTPGAVVELKNVTEALIVTAANVTIRNCVLNAGYFGVDADGAGSGLTVEDCTIIGGSNCGILSGGANATIRRNNISGCADGMKIGGNGILIQDNYIQDLFALGEDPHHDGIQCSGSVGLSFIHNWFGVKDTSGIAMFAGSGSWSNVLIQDNWFTGAPGYYIYAPGTPTNVQVLNNVFDTWGYAAVTDWVTGGGNAWSGNVKASDGTPVNP
jgi:hypothetical protein